MKALLFYFHHLRYLDFSFLAAVSSVLAHGSHKISEKIVKVEICKPFWKPEEKSEAKHEPLKHSPTTHDYEEIPYTLGHPDPSSDRLYPSLMQSDSAPSRSSVAPPSSERLYPSLATHTRAKSSYPSEPQEKRETTPPFESCDRSSKPLASVAPMSLPHSPGVISMPEPVKEMCQETVDIQHGKYKFMKEKIAEKCAAADVRIVSESESGTDQKVHVVLEGTKEAIIQVRLYAFEEMMDVEERSLKLSKVTARILQASSGKSETESKLFGLKVKVMDVKGRLSIVGHQDDVPKAVSIVQGMFSTDNIEIQDHHRSFMKTDAWKEAVNGVQSSRCIEVKEKTSKIELEGIDHEVKDAKATLLQSLTKNSFKKVSVEVKKGVYRFIKMHCRDNIDEIQSE